jgi:hypothetical protein
VPRGPNIPVEPTKRGEAEEYLMRKVVVLTAFVTSGIALMVFAGASLADPPDMLFDPVPKHRHFIRTASGDMVPVGPQICENPNLQQAFNEFHHNVHHSFIPGVGVIHTLGPQDGAPGLHNGQGGEIIALPGCG